MAQLRRPVVAGNWKMHLGRSAARELLGQLRSELDSLTGIDVVICPPMPWLTEAVDALAGSTLQVGVAERLLGAARRLHRRGQRRDARRASPTT